MGKVEADSIKVGRTVLTEDDLKFPVTYNGEVFTLRYPTPYERAAIESEVVRKLGGYPRSSFTDEHVTQVEAMAYVNQLVIPEESPSWFKSAWTCYDDQCVAALYQAYLRFRGKFQDKIRGD